MMSRQDVEALVSEFLKRFSNMEFDRVGDLMSDDVIVEMPYSPNNAVCHGRDDCVSYLDRSVRSFVKKVNFTVTDTVFDYDRQAIMVDHDNNGVRTDGRLYRNRYIGIFHVSEGKVVRWRQFFNPSLL